MEEYIDMEELEDIEVEDVIYLHDIQAEAHRVKRKKDARMKKKVKKNLLTDTSFAKKMLHKANRRSADVTSYTYYKNKYGIDSIEYGLT